MPLRVACGLGHSCSTATMEHAVEAYARRGRRHCDCGCSLPIAARARAGCRAYIRSRAGLRAPGMLRAGRGRRGVDLRLHARLLRQPWARGAVRPPTRRRRRLHGSRREPRGRGIAPGRRAVASPTTARHFTRDRSRASITAYESSPGRRSRGARRASDRTCGLRARGGRSAARRCRAARNGACAACARRGCSRGSRRRPAALAASARPRALRFTTPSEPDLQLDDRHNDLPPPLETPRACGVGAPCRRGVRPGTPCGGARLRRSESFLSRCQKRDTADAVRTAQPLGRRAPRGWRFLGKCINDSRTRTSADALLTSSRRVREHDHPSWWCRGRESAWADARVPRGALGPRDVRPLTSHVIRRA